jgi:uncharacterized protein (TIGR03435 family)
MSTTVIAVTRSISIAIAVFVAVRPLYAQQPVFETASVRVNKEPGRPGTAGTIMRIEPSGLTFLEVSLANCISAAYGVSGYQIKGPGWIRTEWFDIVAKAGKPAGRPELMAMLQTLLAERFALKVRREREPMRAYALVVDKRGARLSVAADSSGDKAVGTGVYRFGLTRAETGWAFKGASMSDFAEYLSNAGPIGVPVVDKTNVAGRFDFIFALNLARLERTKEGGEGPTAYRDALAELGLALQTRKIPLDVITVDHAERVPTPN